MFGKAALDLRPLWLGERQCLGFRGDAVPEVFSELNSLGNTQLEQVVKGNVCHTSRLLARSRLVNRRDAYNCCVLYALASNMEEV